MYDHVHVADGVVGMWAAVKGWSISKFEGGGGEHDLLLDCLFVDSVLACNCLLACLSVCLLVCLSICLFVFLLGCFMLSVFSFACL